ncbi:phage tail spike protein [Bacillus sp. FDAARGOS_1420]|uniref:phage tail spike protein n=1 Tax=unclassified Bacillus (in: firmicutes) TaxID=185979 RepID=UPI001C5B3DFD|nr:phage tail spike protein [Bacillus sp. FDAARGOS_1420]MBW3493254.1 phage tail protein [Bacillus sp. FDAARGOS_1420]
MRIPSGELHVVDFKTEQTVSIIGPEDYWDDVRHFEIKHNIDTLEFTVFDGTEQAATLMQQNLVLKEVRGGRIVPYVITETEKNSEDRTITVYASGEWIQLAKANIIKPQRIESQTVNQFIDMAVIGTKWKRGRTEYAGFHTMTIDAFIDPLKFLTDIASLFELEIQYRVQIAGPQIVGRYVDMVKKRGRETGKEVELGKDLRGIRRIENSQNICTALVGFVKGEGDDLITIEGINNGIPYIVDKDAFQRWHEQGQHKLGFYSPETEDQDMSPQRLLTLMKIEIRKRANASVSYEVEAEAIGRVFGLSHELVDEGDTIRIKDTGFTPELYLEARVIAGDESFTDPTKDKYIFGDYREITDPNTELSKMYNKMLNFYKDTVKKDDIIDAINNNQEGIPIDADKVLIQNEKVSIGKDGVNAKMLDFLYEDERGLKTTVIAKRNLIIDHDFSSVPKPVMDGNPNYSHFESGRFWRPQGNVVLENNTLNFNYERMVNATRVDRYNYPETTVKNGIYPNNIHTLSAHFRCATINGTRVTAKPQLHVCFVTYRDNVHYDIWHEEKVPFDAPSTFYGDIQRRAFTFTVPKNYNIHEHAIVVKAESADGDISKGTAVCVSGIQLVTGRYPSMYEWQAQSAEVYAGTMPIDGLEFGNNHGLIQVARDRTTFDIGGTLETRFHNNIRAAKGVSIGGNPFQSWGHIHFRDGNRGIGFYVNNANGWHFNALG